MKKFILPVLIGVTVAFVTFFGLRMGFSWHENGRHNMGNSGYHHTGGNYNNSDYTRDNSSDTANDNYRYHSGGHR